jgi:hypothetical protein
MIRRMRPARLRLAALFALGAALGCSSLLGIEEWKDPDETVGSGAAGSGEDQDCDDTDAGDAGAPCPVETDDGCANGVQDGEETAVDCGGSVCPACGSPTTCVTDEDCTDGRSCQDGGVCG